MKYKVHGRLRSDIYFEEIVEAKSENLAIKKVEKTVYEKCGINRYDIVDDEIYCDEVE